MDSMHWQQENQYRVRILARRVFPDVTGHAIIRHCCWFSFFYSYSPYAYYDGMRRRGNWKLIGCAALSGP